jgi:hypothetical protein
MDDALVLELMSVFAAKFFGSDAFRDPEMLRPLVKDGVKVLIQTYIAHIWNNMRRLVGLQFERLKIGKAEARAEFDSARTANLRIAHALMTLSCRIRRHQGGD